MFIKVVSRISDLCAFILDKFSILIHFFIDWGEDSIWKALVSIIPLAFLIFIMLLFGFVATYFSLLFDVLFGFARYYDESEKNN